MRISPEQSPNSREQFTKRKRLGQVIIGAGFKPVDPIIHCCPRSQHQDRRVNSARAQLATNFKSVPPGQQHIQHNQVVIIDRGLVQTRISILGHIHRIALLAQALGDDVGHARLIFYQENSHRF